MRNLIKYSVLFCIGATVYFEIELNWRYFVNTLPVHWSMPILGGVLFILIGGLNNWLPWEMSLLLQSLIGAVVATTFEFISGCVLNLQLGLGIWDYSHIPFNIMGQICVPFSAMWVLLAGIAIVLDDYLRYWLFNETKPRYKLF